MIELLRTNDPIHLSWAEALLADAGVDVFVADTHASAIEGSVTAIQRRLMVSEADADHARRILQEAEPSGADS